MQQHDDEEGENLLSSSQKYEKINQDEEVELELDLQDGLSNLTNDGKAHEDTTQQIGVEGSQDEEEEEEVIEEESEAAGLLGNIQNNSKEDADQDSADDEKISSVTTLTTTSTSDTTLEEEKPKEGMPWGILLMIYAVIASDALALTLLLPFVPGNPSYIFSAFTFSQLCSLFFV